MFEAPICHFSYALTHPRCRIYLLPALSVPSILLLTLPLTLVLAPTQNPPHTRTHSHSHSSSHSSCQPHTGYLKPKPKAMTTPSRHPPLGATIEVTHTHAHTFLNIQTACMHLILSHTITYTRTRTRTLGRLFHFLRYITHML